MRLILGHNQFLGISHISEKNASERDSKFSDPQKILEAVQAASECGFKQMIIETHPRMREFMRLYERTKTFDMEFILQVPYVSGYVRHLAEGGVRGVIREMVSGVPVIELVKTPFGLLPKAVRSDYLGIGFKGIDLEMSKFNDFDISGVLLHNVLTDVMLSYDAASGYEQYFDYVQRRFGVKAGLITLNLTMLIESLSGWGLTPGMLMTPINPNGFDMNPSQETVERSVRESRFHIIAMNVLGGGSIKLEDAVRYLKGLPGLDGVVIGASTRKHMEELAEAFEVKR